MDPKTKMFLKVSQKMSQVMEILKGDLAACGTAMGLVWIQEDCLRIELVDASPPVKMDGPLDEQEIELIRTKYPGKEWVITTHSD
jgi:hypothetical protein